MTKIDKKTAPTLRFPEFTDDWEQRKLGDLGFVAMNKRIFKDQTSEYGEIPFFKIGTFGSTPDAFISRKLFEEYKVKYPYPEIGDILISASGSIGRTVVYQGKDEYFQDSNIVWLKHDNQLDNKFLKQFYSIVKWQGLEGSTIKRLYNKNILDTAINIPNVEEQNKIGSFFEKLDATITLHQRKLDLLKEQKKGFLQKMFPKTGERVPELRFEGFTGDWEQRKLNKFTKYESSSYSANQFEENNNYGKFPVFDANKEIARIDTFAQEDEYISIIKDGAGIGRAELRPPKSSIIGTMGYIVIFNSDINFVYALMKNIQWDKYQNGSTIPHVYYRDYGNKKFFIPNLAEQKKIGTFFQHLDQTITLHQRKLDLLKEQKKAFLQQMFV